MYGAKLLPARVHRSGALQLSRIELVPRDALQLSRIVLVPCRCKDVCQPSPIGMAWTPLPNVLVRLAAVALSEMTSTVLLSSHQPPR